MPPSICFVALAFTSIQQVLVSVLLVFTVRSRLMDGKLLAITAAALDDSTTTTEFPPSMYVSASRQAAPGGDTAHGNSPRRRRF